MNFPNFLVGKMTLIQQDKARTGSQDLPEVIHVEPGAWEADGKMEWDSLRITFVPFNLP